MKGWHVAVGALLVLGAAALIALPSALADSGAAANTGRFRFDPPAEPMILTRTFRRPLPGGAEVMTRRSYAIQIHAQESGYRIDGELLDVEAKAPRGFEQLAEIERQRRDASLFPMRLDRTGRFVPDPDEADEAASGPIGTAALDQLERMNLPQSEARNAAAFIARLSLHPVRTSWPDDLFNPAPGMRREVHSVTLPDGRSGQVTIVIDASRDDLSGLLSSFRREVTTSLGTSERMTQETWTLSPKARP